MKIPLSLLLFLPLLTDSFETIYRVRKFIARPNSRRSAADDDLDMAAAELVFKEKEILKPLTTDRIEAPPRKLPFGTEQSVEKAAESAGAPAAEPTFSELQRTHLEDLEKEESKNLKSSMIAPEDGETRKLEELTTEAPTVKNPFSEGVVHDGETSQDRVATWQQPLPSHGRLIAYDFNVNPEYPQFAPRARGLVGIPDGWNLDKTIDEEFKSGFRRVDFRRRRFN
ncbi:unnamed protein product [Caenorhabditis sp. 36 PRJEB53466]|nr:unnamed protein product [Caenorhabditis sp. 36 PRJEB53466]